MAEVHSSIKTATLVVALMMASCSEQDNPDSDQTGIPDTQSTQDKVLNEISRPNPESMEEDVAALVDAAWLKLTETLANEDLTAKAKAQAFADFGLVAFGNGLVLPAESAFSNAAKLSPDEPRWTYFLAILNEYNGNLDAAATQFAEVLALRTDSLPALLRLGEVRLEQALTDEAKSLFQRALEQDPDSAAALYGLGRVAVTEEQYEQAVSYFEKALILQPDADRINYFLGLVWRNLDNREKAQSYLAKRGTIEPSFHDPLFDEISGGEERIDGLWAHMNAGSQAFVDGNYSLAVDEFTLATEDLPDDYRSWQSLGMALNKTKNFDAANSAYVQALSLDKENATVHHEIGKLEIIMGNSEKAEHHLQKAVEIDPGMLAAHRTYARFLLDSGRKEEALERYQQALSLDKQSGELAVAIAQTLAALERQDEAISTLREATEVNPQDASIRMAYGLLLAEKAEHAKAMQEVTRALEYADDDTMRGRAHYAIGQVNLKMGEVEKAIAAFGQALKLNPQHNAAGLELARSFIRVRDFSQALATYEAHIGYWPEEDTNRVEAAKVALMLGDGIKAKSILDAGAKNGAATARLYGTYARLLLLSTDPTVKNPSRALELANKALAISDLPQHRETLALSYAASGNFQEAVRIQSALVLSIDATTAERTKTRMQRNLQRYQAATMGRLPFDAL